MVDVGGLPHTKRHNLETYKVGRPNGISTKQFDTLFDL